MTELAGIEAPEPDQRVTAVRVARWDALRPVRGDWASLIGESAEREKLIGDLRRLADFLETRPEIPMPPPYHEISYTVFAAGSDAEKFAQVDYVGTLLGTPVRDDTPDGGHYYTGLSFGGIEYHFVAIPKEPVARPPVVFAHGQEVRLASEVAAGFRRHGIPQAGVVASRGPHESGEDLYLVKLPGRMSMYFPGSMLEATEFCPVATSRGVVRGLADAETALVGALARCRVSESRRKAPGHVDERDAETLGAALARTCGLSRDALVRLLDGAVGSETDKLVSATRAARREALGPATPDSVIRPGFVPGSPPSRAPRSAPRRR